MERTRENILSSLKSSAAAALSSPSPSSDDALASLDNMLTRMHTLKRKLSSLSADDDLLHRQTRARLAHLQALYSIPSLADVKYDEWSRLRLDRLLVDYLLRAGYGESAAALAREKGIEELVDVGAFVACGRIERSLREGRTAEALAWCAENKIGLRKIGVSAASLPRAVRFGFSPRGWLFYFDEGFGRGAGEEGLRWPMYPGPRFFRK